MPPDSPIPDREAVRALIARLERATGPDRGIDSFIADRIGEDSDYPGSHLGYPGGRLVYLRIASPSYTSNIDAAIALIVKCFPQGWWAIEGDCGNEYTAFSAKVGRWEEEEPHMGDAPSPAFALCLALCRAILANLDDKPPLPEGGETMEDRNV